MLRVSASLSFFIVLIACAGSGGVGGGRPIIDSDVDTAVAGPGASLPFGEIATTCGVSAASLGKPVVTDAGYTIYDTDPTQVTPRTHYVDGFSDGCLRQFTAALVLLGDAPTHEAYRYSAESKVQPYSVTDNAYEVIKVAYCGTTSGQPCGAKLDALSQRTVFVTAYPAFSSSDYWVEYLLHEGVVAGAGRERS